MASAGWAKRLQLRTCTVQFRTCTARTRTVLEFRDREQVRRRERVTRACDRVRSIRASERGASARTRAVLRQVNTRM